MTPPFVVADPGAAADALAQQLRTKARALAEQHDVDLAALRGRRIRVVRAVVYEGEATTVFDQLARSMPIGTAERRVAGQAADPRSLTQAAKKVGLGLSGWVLSLALREAASMEVA